MRPQIDFGVVRTLLFDGFGVTWFFHAQIVSVAVVCLLLISSRKLLLFLVPIGLYIAGTLLNTYFSLLPHSAQGFLERFYFAPFVTARNGLFSGTIYALIGYCLAVNRPAKKNLLLAICAAGLFAAELLLSWRITTKLHGRELFLAMPLLIYALFTILLNIEALFCRLSSTLCFWLRKISFAMYGWQVLYIVVIPNTMNSLLRFVLITAACVLTGCALIWLQRFPRLKKPLGYII